MGIFDKVKDVVTRTNSNTKAPSISSEMDRFLATVAANDLSRTNLFLIRMEKHTSYSTITKSSNASERDEDGGFGSMLNGLTDNSLISEGISAITYDIGGKAQELLKNTIGPYSQKIVKTGFGDYYDDFMGVSNGSIDANSFDPSKTLGMYAESVTLPGVTTDVRKEHQQYQRKNLLAISKDHSPLSITVRCSTDYAEYNYFRWLVDQKIDNKHNCVAFPDDYIIPQVCVFIYNKETNAIATATNNKCIVTSISPLEFNYESNNEIAKFTVELMPEDIKFNTYSPEVGLESVVGGIEGAIGGIKDNIKDKISSIF